MSRKLNNGISLFIEMFLETFDDSFYTLKIYKGTYSIFVIGLVPFL